MRVPWKEGSFFAYLASCQTLTNFAIMKGAFFAFLRWIIPVIIIMVVTNTRIILDDEIIRAETWTILEDKIGCLVTETLIINEQEVLTTVTKFRIFKLTYAWVILEDVIVLTNTFVIYLDEVVWLVANAFFIIQHEVSIEITNTWIILEDEILGTYTLVLF